MGTEVQVVWWGGGGGGHLRLTLEEALDQAHLVRGRVRMRVRVRARARA